MTPFLQYLIKTAICFAVMYLFYAIILKKLTFYRQNRWYFAGYSLLCFIIPFINVNRFVPSPGSGGATIIQTSFLQNIPQVLPLVGTAKLPSPAGMGADTIIMLIIIIGTFLMFLRLMVQYISLRRLKKNAVRISEDERFKIYHIGLDIVPFSFGKSIFINPVLHTELELKEILQHEFVHVKENHTWDILWSELLAVLNWYNPFVWLIRKAIRENLEFIADDKVVQSGINKQQYQYLLLHVMGNNNFSITNKFNFSSLKKRITMMNKVKTSRIHLWKFLFLVPLLSLLLVSFRNIILKDDNPQIAFYGQILNGATDKPLAGVTVEDLTNNIKATTNEDGKYTFDIQSVKSIKLPLSVEFKKPGFEKFTMPVRSLNDKQGEIKNNLYMLNVSLQPQGQADIQPTSVFVGFKAGTEGYKNLKRFWDSISVKENLSSSPASVKQKGLLSISGIVVDNDNFKPLNNVLVKSTDEQIEATTNEKGFFTIHLQQKRGEVNAVNLVYSRKGYAEFKPDFSSNGNKANIYLMANIGMAKEGQRDKKPKMFSASKSQDSEISYKDASEALQSYLHDNEIEKKLSLENKVITQEEGTIYIIGNNIRYTYTATEKPILSVNGKTMSMEEINSTIDAKNVQTISSKGQNEIAITVKKQ